MRRLDHLLARAAERWPERPALEAVQPATGEEVVVSYAELAEEVAALARALKSLEIGAGDRVGICLPKTHAAVVAIHGILAARAAYVPVDAAAPPDRSAGVLEDCQVRAILTDPAGRERLETELQTTFREVDVPGEVLLLVTDEDCPAAGPDLAYVLYTSGSTGRPKGVPITHAAALSFVDWCGERFDVEHEDRFSSHAPFHFDLSILDLYLSAACGGALVLIDEETGRQPRQLAQRIAEKRLTVWYSAPSILALLATAGRLERVDACLRHVLFAGEVFPVAHLRTLTRIWPRARYTNLYGPTETNVCTAYEVTLPIDEGRQEPFPIGPACSHAETAVFDEVGRSLAVGDEGELCVRGAPVMAGYWNRPELDAQVFHSSGEGKPWYRTGDVVREGSEGYIFLGRRDRMVKRRGHRIELGEVEARLARHPDLLEAAVVARADADAGVILEAFLCWRAERPGLLALRSFCKGNLPSAMIPDRFTHRERLPRTSTDKIDYEHLRSLA